MLPEKILVPNFRVVFNEEARRLDVQLGRQVPKACRDYILSMVKQTFIGKSYEDSTTDNAEKFVSSLFVELIVKKKLTREDGETWVYKA